MCKKTMNGCKHLHPEFALKLVSELSIVASLRWVVACAPGKADLLSLVFIIVLGAALLRAARPLGIPSGAAVADWGAGRTFAEDSRAG